mgnify:FL=1
MSNTTNQTTLNDTHPLKDLTATVIVVASTCSTSENEHQILNDLIKTLVNCIPKDVDVAKVLTEVCSSLPDDPDFNVSLLEDIKF